MKHSKSVLVSVPSLLFLIVMLLRALEAPSASWTLQEPSSHELPVSSEATFAARILFGYGNPPQSEWRGALSAEGVEVTAVQGWRLSDTDQVSLGQFELQTSSPSSEDQEPRGILITGRARTDARISCSTNHGNFEFSMADLSPQTDLLFLDGKVRVNGMRAIEKLTDDLRDDDFPSVAARGKSAWVVWQSYSGQADEIRLRKYENGWKTFTRLPGTSVDVWRPQVALDGAGLVWVVWPQQVEGNFDLYARALDEERQLWLPPVRLSTHLNPDINHHLVADREGHLWVVWQGFHKSDSDIFLRHYDGLGWSQEISITEDPANDWEPRIAVDSRGRAHVVWDTYRAGSYDVYLRTWEKGRLGPEMALASTPLFEAHATVAVDRQDRVWVAWDEAGPNWGKDTGLTTYSRWPEEGQAAWDAWVDDPSRPGTRLYEYRKVNLLVLEGGRRKVPLHDLRQALKKAEVEVHDYPQLFIDPDSGRVALLFHRWGQTAAERLGLRRPSWEQAVTFYEGDQWTSPHIMPESWGRPSSIASAAFQPDGSLWVTWLTDGRYQNTSIQDLVGNVYAARIPLPGPPRVVELGEEPDVEPLEALPVHPDEVQDVRTIRAYRSFIHGVEKQIVRGDLHRHTEFSWDSRGNIDGSLLDFYRYMLDAAAMDFGAVTDHNSGGDYEYAWWLIEKSCDLYHIPGRFTTFYGYERSLPFPFGHRNVFHTRRGVPIVSFFTRTTFDEPRPRVAPRLGQQVLKDDTRLLYESLHQTGGLSIPHTTATNMGTDWSDNDPEVEPVVEIFQGDRTSYEHPGGPRAPRGEQDTPPYGGYRDEGFVWNALAKGYRIVTIASSDHWSTHLSYAMVFTETPTRLAIFEAIKRRHTYGATDNIVLDYRLGEYFMGDEFTASQVPPLEIYVLGTSPVSRIEIIKNEKVVYTATPGKKEVKLSYLDQDAGPGTSYYYVRLTQEDGHVAWGSPIWVTRQP